MAESASPALRGSAVHILSAMYSTRADFVLTAVHLVLLAVMLALGARHLHLSRLRVQRGVCLAAYAVVSLTLIFAWVDPLLALLGTGILPRPKAIQHQLLAQIGRYSPAPWYILAVEAYEDQLWLSLVGPVAFTLWALCGGMLRYLPREHTRIREPLLTVILHKFGSKTPAPVPVFTPQAFLARLVVILVYGVPHCPPLAALLAVLELLATQAHLTRRIYPRALAALFGLNFFVSACALLLGTRAGELNYVVGGTLTFSIGFASLAQVCCVTLDPRRVGWHEDPALSPGDPAKQYEAGSPNPEAPKEGAMSP